MLSASAAWRTVMLCASVSAQQVGAVAGRFKRGDQRFAGVHIGVLAAIAVQVRPVGAGLVGVQAMLRVPEALLHQLKGFGGAACVSPAISAWL
jgi:hypothetical protein